MPSGPVFDAVWARCLNHKTLLEPGERECFQCRILERNLSLKPPFRVLCICPEWGEAKPGEYYDVFWVIKTGMREYGELMGYAFSADKESVNDHVFDAENFIPVEFLTQDNKDSWVEEEPDPNPVISDEDMYGVMA
jgi:hypothetical protein